MPDLWQPVAKHLLFPWHARREGSGLPAKLGQLRRSEHWSAARIGELQLSRLRTLLEHAGAHSPWYREIFAQRGFDPATVGSLDDLRRLPTLSKSEVQEHADRMRAEAHPGTLMSDRTGGSTGQPVRFYLDSERFHWRRAIALRHDMWTGWDIGDKAAYVWGHRRDLMPPETLTSRLRTVLLERSIGLDSSTLSAEALAGFQRRLDSFKPVIWVGYANSLHLLATWLRDHGGAGFARPRAVISSAEYLEPSCRRDIEASLGCPVLDRYGSRETGLIASECGAGEGMHVAAEGVLVEVLKGDRPAEPGETGRIVVTDLLNFGMPLIRYEIRDAAVPLAGDCACGRSLPRIRMEGGRVSDFIITPEETVVSGTALTIFLVANAPGVGQAQLVQETRDELIVRLVPGAGYGDGTRAFFTREMPRFIGPTMGWRIEEVAEIPPTASGKHRFCVSSLDTSELF